MTKRFQIIGENYTNIDMPVFIVCKEDDCCFEVYESKEDAQIVCDKLNNLVEENEQLKSEVAHYKQILMGLEEEAKRLTEIHSKNTNDWFISKKQAEAIDKFLEEK